MKCKETVYWEEIIIDVLNLVDRTLDSVWAGRQENCSQAVKCFDED